MGPLPMAYIETTIPSFYWDTREEPEIVLRRDWTRRWWLAAGRTLTLVTSQLVIAELEAAPEPKRSRALEMLHDLPWLPITNDVTDTAEVYIARGLMPRRPAADALHLALASVHACAFLVTWNCAHLANARKLPHLRVVHATLGLAVPILATPEQMMEAPDVPDV